MLYCKCSKRSFSNRLVYIKHPPECQIWNVNHFYSLKAFRSDWHKCFSMLYCKCSKRSFSNRLGSIIDIRTRITPACLFVMQMPKHPFASSLCEKWVFICLFWIGLFLSRRMVSASETHFVLASNLATFSAPGNQIKALLWLKRPTAPYLRTAQTHYIDCILYIVLYVALRARFEPVANLLSGRSLVRIQSGTSCQYRTPLKINGFRIY